MTASEMIKAIGKQVMMKVEDLKVLVTIKDVKQAYGQVRVQVEPVQGIGTQWVSVDRLSGVPMTATEVKIQRDWGMIDTSTN